MSSSTLWRTSARTCSGLGINIGAAFSGMAKAAAKIVAVRTDKSFFIAASLQEEYFRVGKTLGHPCIGPISKADAEMFQLFPAIAKAQGRNCACQRRMARAKRKNRSFTAGAATLDC